MVHDEEAFGLSKRGVISLTMMTTTTTTMTMMMKRRGDDDDDDDDDLSTIRLSQSVRWVFEQQPTHLCFNSSS